MTEKRPLKVGIIGPCPKPHGGVTRVLQNHLKYWEGGPIRTWLMTEQVHETLDVYPQTELVPMEKLGLFDYVAAFFRVGWRFALCRPKFFLRLLAFDVTVRRAIRKYGFDVIYAHHSMFTGLIAVTEAKAAGIPSVITSYGETWLADTGSRKWRRAIHFSIKNASHVVSTSEHCRNGALSRGAERDRTSVIYAGIDLEQFRPGLDCSAFRKKMGVPSDAIVISVLGLALRRKLDTFLDALDLLMQRQDVYVLIGGTGDDRAYLEERTAKFGDGRVKTLGFVAEAELPEFYGATDVLVVAPRTIVECMGQSMKEAMSCGRAVAGARLGGVPEALGEEKCGLMFEPDNPEDLARVLDRLINDGQLRTDLGARGREEAKVRFDAFHSAEQMLALLQQVLENSGKMHSGQRM